jgi:hypothetical protein
MESTPTKDYPFEKYVVEVDGKVDSEYGTLMGALSAGLELMRRFPNSKVKVRDVKEQAPMR